MVKSYILEADFCVMLIKRVFSSPVCTISIRRLRSLVHPGTLIQSTEYTFQW